MNREDEIVLVSQESIHSKIHTVRHKKVMLDFELAEIYGYETKRFNAQVKNNIEKFDQDFRFQLTAEEFANLRSKISTSSWGGNRYLPFAFTEEGIYMLMTVLKGNLAVKQSKALIRTFKQMKDYIIDNQSLVGQREYLQLSLQTTENLLEIRDLRESLVDVEDRVAKVIDTLSTVVTKSDLAAVILDFSNPSVKRDYLVLNGQPVEANLAYTDIYALARESIYIIDNYIGLKTLVMLKKVPNTVHITIFSDNRGKGLHLLEYQDFAKEYPSVNIDFRESGAVFHDRYIIIDWGKNNARVFHCGASSKDAGDRITTVSEVTDIGTYTDLVAMLVQNPIFSLK